MGKSGQRACDSQALQNAVTLEYKQIRSILGYNNPDNHFDEYFADAIAEFYLKPDQLMKKCPNTYNYISTLAF